VLVDTNVVQKNITHFLTHLWQVTCAKNNGDQNRQQINIRCFLNTVYIQTNDLYQHKAPSKHVDELLLITPHHPYMVRWND